MQDWLADNLPEGARVGIDPFVHTIEAAEKLRKRLRAAGKSLVPLGVNPVDGVWEGRPAAPEVRASGRCGACVGVPPRGAGCGRVRLRPARTGGLVLVACEPRMACGQGYAKHRALQGSPRTAAGFAVCC